MITTTHAVINAVVARRSCGGNSGTLDVRSMKRLFVLGGVAPDVALYVLTVAALIYYPVTRGLGIGDTHRLVADDLFFNSPLWIVGHHTLHAPLVLGLLYAGAAWMSPTRRRRPGAFVAGSLLHTAVDVVTHHDDGPLLLLPLSWSLRFPSPVSYWDPDHFGLFLLPLDIATTFAGAVWLVLGSRSRST